MTQRRHFDISMAGLHLLAMLLMLFDHLWATVLTGQQWMTCLGRVAFPIFAFMLVEGYFRTGSLRRYALRLLLFAVLSEIPFNLIMGDSVIYPVHQNIMWTLLMGLGAIHLNEKARLTGRLWRRILTAVLTVLGGFLLGFLTMTDYFGVGVITPLVFYFFRQRKWWAFAGQLLVLYYLNVEVLSGRYFVLNLLGMEFNIVQQGLALFALIPIWLYRGRQGHHSKAFQYACYAFYPAHMLLLWILANLLH